MTQAPQDTEDSKLEQEIAKTKRFGILAIITGLLFISLAILTASVVIKGLSSIAGGFSFNMMDWTGNISIIPGTPGFKYFVSMIFTTGFIGGILYWLTNKG